MRQGGLEFGERRGIDIHGRAVEMQALQLVQAAEMNQAGLADLRAVQVEPPQVRQAAEVFQAGCRDVREG